MVAIDELKQMTDAQYTRKISFMLHKGMLEKREVEPGSAWVYELYSQIVATHDFDRKTKKGAVVYVRPAAFKK